MKDLNNNFETGNVASQGSQEPDIMKVFEVEQEQQVTGVGEDNMQLIAPQDESAEVSQDNIEIDEKFANLPKAEALLRTYQSRYDKLYNEHQNLARELEQYRQYRELVDQLMSDDEVFEAFVYQRKPDLVKPKDITEIIKEKLKEEFGDYRPTREEADADPGGKAWLYYKRLDELYNELKGKGTTKAKTIEEIMKQKAMEREQQEKMLVEEINKVKTSMNWDDTQLERFRDWASKLSVLDLAKIYNFALRTMRIPSATQVTGTAVKGMSKERLEFLSKR